MNPWYPLETPLVLASASPRRLQLLQSVGIPLKVHPSGVEEDGFPGEARNVVIHWASRKAEAVAPSHPGHPVLGADTMVYLEGMPLGKPRDPGEAVEMLNRLSGREHTVHGGVCILAGGRREVLHQETRVLFRELSPLEIETYVASGEPMDKAGSYGAQGLGGLFIREIHGCWFNVVGLPLPRVVLELRRLLGAT